MSALEVASASFNSNLPLEQWRLWKTLPELFREPCQLLSNLPFVVDFYRIAQVFPGLGRNGNPDFTLPA